MDSEAGRPNDEGNALRSGTGNGELLTALKGLLGDASRMLTAGPSHAVRVARLAGYVSEIRYLLSELYRYSPRQGGAGITPGQCRELVEQYRDLEGTIKELRNDLVVSPTTRGKGNGI